ncbi:shikimate kinase [Pleomorphomonas sp. NRK KF1]|uniref:shikimate kinase n=1 Tax=Pleomorphomonas sp. NRK KF1 TaxID=2943000 RepID=UPI002042C178|nr:shikimate kinase [Pleomorphomonas sp. NRK KF1]MCM5554350.1 shikimate kinase [Pleomorphomonas sp. NRK KF1]
MTDVKTNRNRDTDAAHRRASANARIVELLGGRSVVLVGMMGAGKTSVGKRLAGRLGLTFIDADTAIEEAAKKTVSEIFAEHGEDYFRQGERRVIARLLREPRQIIATGGGAFMNPETRAAIRGAGISIWLRADWELLFERVRRRPTRPLLQTADPEGTLRALVDARYPVYAEADLTVQSVDVPHEAMVDAVVSALEAWLVEDTGREHKAP